MIATLRRAWRRATYRAAPSRVTPTHYTVPALVFEGRPWAHWHADPANCATCRGWRPVS